MKPNQEKLSLKDKLFSPKRLKYLAGLIKDVYPEFELNKFITQVLAEFPKLELKARIEWIRICLKEFLPNDYESALKIILKSLPPESDPSKSDNDFGEFILTPFSDYIAAYGCSKKYLKISLEALEQTTKRFSAEDSIRYFFNAFPEETLKKMATWSKHENYHVRRLASEGSRPRLPWSQKIDLDNEEGLKKILDNLYYDKTRFVVRSVANHLNDISKTDPQLVIATLKRWQASKKQNEKEMAYLTSHALRTSIKAGNKEALALLGYQPNPKIEFKNFTIHTQFVTVGDALEFSFELEANADEKLMIDYLIHFQSKRGRLLPKVFKIKKTSIKKGTHINVAKKHPLKIMTTKKLYPGTHKIEIQINGQIHKGGEFELKLF
ncbi:MAG: 3-methyladenine DNA glycosylase AlkC [Oceanicoccus sp.]|jgi:3-methyladenine DNA glycosylase AlkC